MLGRGNWNSFTFRELKNNVKIRTMRGRSFWHSLKAPGKRDSSRREERHTKPITHFQFHNFLFVRAEKPTCAQKGE